jgi:phosphoesterase RecJ-like protein
MLISESSFKDLIGRFIRVLYLCHHNADPDAIGSAYALQQGFGGTVASADEPSRAGKALAQALGALVLINPRTEDYDLTVVVDTSVRLQLGSFQLGRYAVIDHHLDEGLLAGAEFHIQRPCKAAAEIVWTILKESDVQPSREAALGLLAGIISDTGRFRRASPAALRASAELLEASSLDFEDVLQTLSIPQDISQRIAVLRAATRAEIDRQGDWLIAVTEINSFEGSAAMALVDLGADVAFAAGRHGDLTRVSARAGREAARSGLNLAAVLSEVARTHGGEGGGHRAAAALEARDDPGVLLGECRKKVAVSLGQS